LLFGVLAALTFIALALSGAPLVAIPFGVIGVTLLTLASLIWSRARGDITDGAIIRAKGQMAIWDKTYYEPAEIDLGFGRTCALVVNGVRLKVEDAAAASIWSLPAATKVKHSDGLFSEKEIWAFKGVVEYAPRSLILLRISTPRGRLIWQQSRLVAGSDSSPKHTPPRPGSPSMQPRMDVDRELTGARSPDGRWGWTGDRWVAAPSISARPLMFASA
jgi:hypothetical protein